MRRIIDLTNPIEEHWRYGIKFEEVESFEKGDQWQSTAYNLRSHWFTHMDFPVHFQDHGKDSNDYPLDYYAITNCLVLDLSYVGDNEGITAEMLEKANEPFKDQHFDSILIRSDRPKKVSWKTTEFWDNSCYVTEDGAIWIRDYAPRAVGYDFAQDYEIRLIRNRKPGQIITQPVHQHVLVEGQILQFEYITNLWNIKHPTCTLICLPLNTQHANGTQIRLVAVVDE
ncbi:cyclase family protein [Oribacterium sp. HCP28S3_H8]|jgi:arylformamidase|uniref:cyclase family protein n=1 Tax=Oribacterium sp. HCP28S3_H8 TaxID=3438945 RepID=UPI003F89EA93